MNERHICPFLSGDREYKRATLERVLSQNPDWQKRDGTAYPMGNAALGAALSAGASYERKQPSERNGTFISEFVTPLAQSLATGVFLGAVGLLVGDARTGAVTCILTSTATWLLRLKDGRALAWSIERLVGHDLTGDGIVGDPSTVSVEIIDRKRIGGTIKYAKLPISDDKLRDVAIECLKKGAAFSRPALSNVLSQNEYHDLARAMVDAGLVVDLPGNKRELSAAGRTLLTQLLDN